MISRRILLVPLLSALVLAASSDVRASVARAIPFDEKVTRADSIVLGKVVSSRSEMAPDGRFIVTHTTFEIEETLKGQTPARVTVTTPGGSVGSLHQRSVGIPEFREGDEKVVFLTARPNGVIAPLYFDQGTYDVIRPSSGEPVVKPVNSSLVLLDSQTGLATDGGESPRTLRAFQTSVRQVVARHQMQGLAAPPASSERSSWSASLADWFSEHGLLVALGIVALGIASIPLLRRR